MNTTDEFVQRMIARMRAKNCKPHVRVIKVSGKDMFVANTCVGFVASYKWSLLWAKANNPHHFPNGLVNPTLCKRMAIGGPLLVYRP